MSAVDPKVAVTVLYKDELDASDNIVNATAAKAAAYAAENCGADAALAAGVADFAVAPAQLRGPWPPPWICWPPSAPSVCPRSMATWRFDRRQPLYMDRTD